MSDEIIDDLTPEIIAQYTAPVSKIFKIYFDPLTKDVLAISKTDRDDYTTYFETHADNILDFLSGVSNFNEFRVVVTPENEFKLVSKIVRKDLKASALVSITTDVENPALTITNNIIDSKWVLELAEDQKLDIINSAISYIIEIYITGTNKNYLYRVLTADLRKLATIGKIVIPHELDIESLPNKIMLSTPKLLDSYQLRNSYESEV